MKMARPNSDGCLPGQTAVSTGWAVADRGTDTGELLAAILREVLALRTDVAALANGSAILPVLPASTLPRAIFEFVGARAFSAAELLEHSALVPELRAAILGEIRVPNARKLGKRLAALEGHNLDRRVVTRLGSDSTGAIWSVRRV